MDTTKPHDGRFMLGIIIGLLLALLSGAWLFDSPLTETAWGQVPDAGAQRNELLKQLIDLNDKMDRLLTVLESGQIKVICVPTDKDTRRQRHEIDKRHTEQAVRPSNPPAAGGYAR